MTKLIEFDTPKGDIVFINPDQVTMLKDMDQITHVFFTADSSGPSFCAVHLEIREVAKLLSGD